MFRCTCIGLPCQGVTFVSLPLCKWKLILFSAGRIFFPLLLQYNCCPVLVSLEVVIYIVLWIIHAYLFSLLLLTINISAMCQLINIHPEVLKRPEGSTRERGSSIRRSWLGKKVETFLATCVFFPLTTS